MIKATVATTLLLICTATGFAQTSQTFGAWSVTTLTGRHGEATTLLQTSSLDHDQDAQGQPVGLKLDVICKQGQLSRVALETAIPVSRHAMNNSGEVATTPVSFRGDANGPQVQSWAVLDSGHTVSPYSELMQGRKNRYWMEHVVVAARLSFEFRGASGEDLIQAHFDPTGLSEAMAATGCAY